MDDDDDDNITAELDGTFTVRFLPWYEEPIRGIPTRAQARNIYRIAYEAMLAYARDAMDDG